MLIPFETLRPDQYIRGPRFTVDMDSLRTYKVDLRQVLSDNPIKGGSVMRGMKVNIATNHLLEVVKRNRETYAKILEEAKIEWRKKVIAAMEVNLEDAQAGGPVRTGIALPPPPDHLEEYDQAIAMLELSEDAQMELTSDQFDALVRNKWDWMGSAKVSMLSYCASAASLPD